jgi:catecholate siderophore receptor
MSAEVRRGVFALWCSLLVAGLSVFAVEAQSELRPLQGRGLDATRSAIVGARITAVGEGRLSYSAVVSDENGEFSLNLAPGNYTLEAAADGFQRSSLPLNVQSTSIKPHEIVLQIEEHRDVITVTEAPGYEIEATASATKTNTPLRDIPQTLNVVPRELLIEQNAQSVADALKNVPGVSIAQGEGNRDHVVLRGISTASDFFVNGVRDDQERFRDLYNVESIDVVQGPAAVLFGRGGAGGVVNLVTRKPMRGAPSDAALDFGSNGHKRSTAQVGARLGAGDFRMSLMAENSGGFRDGYFLHRYGLNPTVAFNLGKATTLTAGFEHLYDARLADRGIPSQSGRPVNVRAGQLFGSPDQNRARSGVESSYATLEHRFHGGLQLRNNFLAGKYDKFYQNVYPGNAVNASGTLTLSAYNHQIDRTNVFNQTDLIYQANFGATQHTLLFGSEVGHQFQDEARHTASAITNVAVSNSARDANFTSAPLVIDRHAASDILAGYVQDQIGISDHLKAVAGARVDWFKVNVNDHIAGNANLARADTAASPRLGFIYQPNATASFYTSYSYTFLPSGQNLGLALNTVQLEPENARNYEAGAKLDLLGKKLNLTAAVFRLDRNNVKNTDPNDPSRLVLTGQQRTEGAMVSLTGRLSSRWRIYAGYANLNARTTANTTSAPAGRKVGLVPRSQFTLWSTYDLFKHWGVGGGLMDQTKMYASFSNRVELPAYERVDTVLYYRTAAYRIAVNTENLFNRKYYSTANGDNNISPGAPRTVRLSLTTSF